MCGSRRRAQFYNTWFCNLDKYVGVAGEWLMTLPTAFAKVTIVIRDPLRTRTPDNLLNRLAGCRWRRRAGRCRPADVEANTGRDLMVEVGEAIRVQMLALRFAGTNIVYSRLDVRIHSGGQHGTAGVPSGRGTKLQSPGQQPDLRIRAAAGRVAVVHSLSRSVAGVLR